MGLNFYGWETGVETGQRNAKLGRDVVKVWTLPSLFPLLSAFLSVDSLSLRPTPKFEIRFISNIKCIGVQ